MELKGKVIAVTGGASGIGAALCQRFAAEDAAHVAVCDLDRAGAETVARGIGGSAHGLDVADRAQVDALVAQLLKAHGRVDLFVSNAGIGGAGQTAAHAASAPEAVWHRAFGVNVMAHVHAANAVLPSMLARGEGYILNTVSAAGLLSQIGNTVYSVTKHAAVGFAESLAIAHGDKGIRVSILCPQGVDTPMLRGSGAEAPQNRDGVLSPEAVAQSVVEGLAAERFLILPHAEVATYMQRKTADYDRWLSGMQRLRIKATGA